LSGDLSRFITWSDHLNEATVYELKTGTKINSVPKGDTIRLNRDGTKLLIRRKFVGDVRLWDVDAGKELWSARFGGKERDEYTFRFSDDGKIVTGSCDIRLPIQPEDYPRTYVWNVETGKEIAMFRWLFMDRYFGKVNRMLGSLPVERFGSKDVLCDVATGEVIAEDFTGSYVAVSNDEQRFLTHDRNTSSLLLWDSKTGELLHTIESDSIVPYRTKIVFDSDPTLLRATTPVEHIDSRFVSHEVLIDIDTGKIVKREDMLPSDTRFGDIVWRTFENSVVFWNLEDGQAFFTIRLPQPAQRFGSNIIGPIHFTPDGGELIYSTKMRPFMQRVIF